MMAEETPKKIVDEGSKCFTCSTLCPGKDKAYIFGKTSHNFAEIIKSTLNIDVNCYANDANTKLFVCKTLCYKRLLKFQRATEKVEEARKEIQDAFQARPRAKRLIRPTDGDQEEISGCWPSTNRAKASRTLKFSSANSSSATCTSSFGIQPLLAGANPLSYVRGFLSPIQQIGPNYRVFPHVDTTQDFRPPLTSTPSCSSANRENSLVETQQVRLSVQYPSKSLNKTLHGTYQNVGKALAHGVPSRIAAAVMNYLPVRNHILEKVMKVVSKEVTSLCSKTNPSLVRKTGKKDLEKFDLEDVCKEWRERAPIFYSFLLTSAVNKNTNMEPPWEQRWQSPLPTFSWAQLKQKS